MIDVKHLNSSWNRAIKNQVIIKTRNLPGTEYLSNVDRKIFGAGPVRV